MENWIWTINDLHPHPSSGFPGVLNDYLKLHPVSGFSRLHSQDYMAHVKDISYLHHYPPSPLSSLYQSPHLHLTICHLLPYPVSSLDSWLSTLSSRISIWTADYLHCHPVSSLHSWLSTSSSRIFIGQLIIYILIYKFAIRKKKKKKKKTCLSWAYKVKKKKKKKKKKNLHPHPVSPLDSWLSTSSSRIFIGQLIIYILNQYHNDCRCKWVSTLLSKVLMNSISSPGESSK